MLSVSDPSLLDRLVASMPLNCTLFDVVRRPLTDGEILPVPFTSTGGRSALTPGSADKRWVKLRVAVGTCSSSRVSICREMFDVFGVSSGISPTTVSVSLTAPSSSRAGTVETTAASTAMPVSASF
jgi:hypothetical protein